MDQRQKIILGVLATVLVAILVAVAVVFLDRPEAPAFTPPPFEAGAVAGEPTPPDASDYRVFSVADIYDVGLCGAPLLREDGSLDLFFANPASNQVWIRLRLYDEAGGLLYESGLLRPGEYLPAASLAAPINPGAALSARVYSYEPDTYYSQGSASAVLAPRAEP